MRSLARSLLGLALLAGTLLAGSSAAEAHPHVWITVRTELVYAPDGSLTGVRHAWTFDDKYSTDAVQGIETKTKGVYPRGELAARRYRAFAHVTKLLLRLPCGAASAQT